MQKIGLEAVLDMANFKGGLKDFTGGIDTMIDKSEKGGGALGKLGSVLGGLAKVGVGAAIAGIGALTGVIAASIGPAAEAQAIEAQLDAVLRSTGGAAGMTKDAILGLATALSEVTPFEDDLIASTETVLLQFKNIGKEVFPQATEMALDLSQRLGIDAVSAAKLLGKALEKPGEGLLRLKQAGVAFTDEQEAMINKMVAAGDAAGAQKYIMDQLALSVGGSARAAGETFSGQMEILKNKIGNVQEAIGTAFLPILTQLVSKFSEFVTTNGPAITAFFQKLATWLEIYVPKAIQWTIDKFVWLKDNALAPAASFIINTLVPKFIAIRDWLQTNVPAAAQWTIDKFNWLKDNVLAPVAGFIGGTLIPKFTEIATWIGTNVPGAVQWTIDKFTILKDTILPPLTDFIGGTLIPKFIEIYNWLQTKIPEAVAAVSEVWNNLKTTFDTLGVNIYAVLIPALTSLKDSGIDPATASTNWLKQAWLDITAAWKDFTKFYGKDFMPAMEGLAGYIETAIGDTVEWAKKLWSDLEPAMTWIKKNCLEPWAKVWSDIGDAISDVVSWIQKLIDKLEELVLPDWLTPGSPTPFELGVRGIGDALRDVARQGLPELTFGFRGLSPAGAGSSVTNNSIGGDTIVLNINSRDAWAGAQSWIESRRRERINVGM